jgi:hypothetical protein
MPQRQARRGRGVKAAQQQKKALIEQEGKGRRKIRIQQPTSSTRSTWHTCVLMYCTT